MTSKAFVPAAGVDWLLPFYDSFSKWIGVESVHRRLIDEADIQPGQHILEIGCGTGNLVILAKRLNPATEVVGLDADPKALTRALRKTAKYAVGVRYVLGYAEELPYPDGSFDRVLSALMLHHLQPEVKHLALREVRRLLKPTGSLHLVDITEGMHPTHRRFSHHAHPSNGSRVGDADSIPSLMQKAGFGEAREIARQTLLVGQVAYYRGVVD